jgi:PadR family transcriptional regulator, regulatory protein PadR
MTELRMTLQVQLVLRELLGGGGAERYGLELCAGTGLPSGTIYPIVARLEQAGWVESWWEDPARHVAEGRPRRRYYRLTRDGADLARAALARADRARARRSARPGLAAPGASGVLA